MTVIAFAVTAVAAAGAGDEPGVPTALSIENQNLDLGRVFAGATATATFVFHNNGPHDIKILRAAPA